MGTSTDGILAYGYDLQRLGEGMRFHGLTKDEVPRWLLEIADGDDRDGDPGDYDWKDFGEAAEYRLLAANGFTETYEDGHQGYFTRKRAVEETLGVQIETHCSGEYEMYLLAARVITASRGTPVAVDLTLPDTTDERLAWAVGVLGLDVGDQKPCWLLASYWG